MKKKLLLTTLLTTTISLIAIGGISVSADTLKTSTEVLHDITPKAKTVYTQDSFRFTTVGVPSVSSSYRLSLEDYLKEEIRNFNTEFINIQSYKISTDDLKNIFGKILCENPDLFYLTEKYSYSWDEDNIVVGIKFNYNTTAETYDTNKAIIDEKFAPVIDTITDDMSDYEKALVVHDFICTNFSYDLTYSVYNLLDFVQTGTGVCQAYYQAYNYILTELGIKSYPIQSDGINHIWNIVKLDGKYYQVDTTWDDYTPDLLGWSSHSNFLMDDTSSARQHSYNGTIDWYTYEDGLSATDDTFNNYEFKNQNNPFVVINSDVCYLNSGVLCKYDFSTNSSTSLNEFAPNHKWYNLNASVKQYYKQSFYSINKYKDIFFINTSEKVLVLNDDYQIIDTLYTHTDTTNTLIYGMTIRDGYVLIQLESNPNVSTDTFGKNIVAVCNVDEYYQNYVNNKDYFTTTTTTTTPMTTTTTPMTTTTTTPMTTTTTPMTTTTTTPITTTTTPMTTTTTTTTTPEITSSTIFSTNPTTVTTPSLPTDTTTITTTLTTTTVDIPIEFNYDVNGNGSINVIDLILLNSYIYNQSDFSNIYYYDINNDNEINILDLIALKKRLLLNN